MSHWVSSLSSSSALWQTLALTVLLMHLGCIDAGTAKPVRHPEGLPEIKSAKELQSLMSGVNYLLHNANQDFNSIKNSTTSLRKNFDEYSNKTARHAWPSARKQHIEEGDLREEAERLQTRMQKFRKQMQTFKPIVQKLRDPAVRSFARDVPTKKQMDQNIKLYEIMMHLISTFIECPMHILEVLNSSEDGGNGSSIPYDGEPPEETMYPEYY